MHAFATGLRDVGRGLAVLKAHPSLWKWLIAPALITLVLLAAAVVGVLHVIDPVVGWVTAHLPGALASVAGAILHLLIAVVLGTAGLFVFATIAGIIAGPFNERLSEHLEAVLTGRPPAPFSLREFVHGAALGIVHAIRRLAVALIGLVLVLALGFVPVIGTIAAVLVGAWLAASAASYDCYDAVFGRRTMAYRDKLAYLARHRGRTLGLGLAVAGMLLVPVLNLLALGIGSAGATLADLSLATPAGSRTLPGTTLPTTRR
jgi:CysZ protein